MLKYVIGNCSETQKAKQYNYHETLWIIFFMHNKDQQPWNLEMKCVDVRASRWWGGTFKDMEVTKKKKEG